MKRLLGTTRKRKTIFVLAVGLASFALVGTALAIHPPTLVHSTAGTLATDVRAHSDGVTMVTHGSTVVIQDITYTSSVGDPADSGWHTHPGVVLVVVESGTLTFHQGCTVTNYTTGQAFFETGDTPVRAENLDTITPAVIHATFIVPTTDPLVLKTAADPPVCD